MSCEWPNTAECKDCGSTTGWTERGESYRIPVCVQGKGVSPLRPGDWAQRQTKADRPTDTK